MEKQPNLIRDFSKEEFPEERTKVAHAIKEKRAERFEGRVKSKTRKNELLGTLPELEKSELEQFESITSLENEIAELSNSGLEKIRNFFEIRKLRADIRIGQKEFDELHAQRISGIFEKDDISSTIDSQDLEIKNILRDFYRDQEEKWENKEYNKEDIKKYFSEEYLSSLSLKDYALMLKRFPSEMVTHVTRQGVRDHTGHLYHNTGLGVYTDGFMKIAEDGRLRSPLGVCLVEKEKEKAMERFLFLDNWDNKEEAKRSLNKMTKPEQGEPGVGDYSDRMAIHFATQEVADVYYGAEKGNEIFIAYPSAHIASQYLFKGQLNKRIEDSSRNDQWVWANEERGMSLNAGVVFIPKEAKVDPENGSQYELDENMTRIENKENKDNIKKIMDYAVNNPDFEKQIEEVVDNFHKNRYHADRGDVNSYRNGLMESVKPLCKKLEKEFGKIDETLLFVYFRNSLWSSSYTKNDAQDFNRINKFVEGKMNEEGILYYKAKNTISSKEFWNRYFTKNSDKKPSKIVYYQDSDPTTALGSWKKENGIYGFGKETDENIGFSENHMDEEDMPKVLQGMDRFKSLAGKVIDDYFERKEQVSK